MANTLLRASAFIAQQMAVELMALKLRRYMVLRPSDCRSKLKVDKVGRWSVMAFGSTLKVGGRNPL